MREIKFTISNEELAKLNNSFDQEQLRDMIADEINNSDSSVWSDVASKVIENLDYGDIDYNEIVENIDIYELRDKVIDENTMNNYNYSTIAEDLLIQYRPDNGCSTGNEFTRAIERAIVYIFENEDNSSNGTMDKICEEIVRRGMQQILQKQTITTNVNNVVVPHTTELENIFNNLGNDYNL
jgi:hypothetical protein